MIIYVNHYDIFYTLNMQLVRENQTQKASSIILGILRVDEVAKSYMEIDVWIYYLTRT